MDKPPLNWCRIFVPSAVCPSVRGVFSSLALWPTSSQNNVNLLIDTPWVMAPLFGAGPCMLGINIMNSVCIYIYTHLKKNILSLI